MVERRSPKPLIGVRFTALLPVKFKSKFSPHKSRYNLILWFLLYANVYIGKRGSYCRSTR